MKSKHKSFFIIAVGVMFLGMQGFVPGVAIAETDSEAALKGGVVDRYNAILTDREHTVSVLAEYWAPDSGESVETLTQVFSKATTQQLLAIDQSTVYEQVQAALDLGDTDRDMVFTPVPPCKIVDTRDGGGGVFFPNQQRNYNVYGFGGTIGPQGGNPAGCPSPRGEPRAVHLSIGTYNAQGTGNIQAYPVGASFGAGISENFASFAQTGYNFINTGPVQTCYACGDDVTIVARFAQTHVLAFALGYYHEVDKDDADRLALAYANIEGFPGVSFRSRTENVSSVVWNAGSSRYEITIAGENFFYANYSVVVTPILPNDVVVKTDSIGGKLLIQFRDAVPAGEGNFVRAYFSFVAFKDQ